MSVRSRTIGITLLGAVACLGWGAVCAQLELSPAFGGIGGAALMLYAQTLT